MALPLYIPPCIDTPPHPLHPPTIERPLRICIEGPSTSIQKLIPDAQWHLEIQSQKFPQPAGLELARLTYKVLFGRDPPHHDSDEIKLRDEYLGFVVEAFPDRVIDYYGVTFDHYVPVHDNDPEVLQINIIEMDSDEGAYARQWLRFQITPDDWREQYRDQRVLAVPRCCGKRKGTTDRARVNNEVQSRDEGKKF